MTKLQDVLLYLIPPLNKFPRDCFMMKNHLRTYEPLAKPFRHRRVWARGLQETSDFGSVVGPLPSAGVGFARVSTCIIITGLLLALPTLHAQTGYTNKWSTADGGGRSSTGGVYTISGTAGQPDAGVMQRGEYTVNGGFWGMIAVVQTPGAPPLSIRRGDGTNVLVCWPYPSESYGLQQCTNLTTANWAADASVPAHVGNEWQVTVSPPAGKRYYRLQKP